LFIAAFDYTQKPVMRRIVASLTLGGSPSPCQARPDFPIWRPDELTNFDECGSLIANGEALSLVLGVLEFVDESARVVLEGNTAVALGIGDQVVFAQPELAYALAGPKECGRTEVSPLNAALFQIPKHLNVSIDYGDPFLGKVSGCAQRDARCDEEAACSADYDEAGSAGLLDSFDEAIRNADDLASVVRWRPISRDDGVHSLDDDGGLCRIAEVVLDCGDVFDLSHLFWIAGRRDDEVTAIDQLRENDAT
jgi:hypothetical protein